MCNSTGTLGSNRKGNSKQITQKKIKKMTTYLASKAISLYMYQKIKKMYYVL